MNRNTYSRSTFHKSLKIYYFRISELKYKKEKKLSFKNISLNFRLYFMTHICMYVCITPKIYAQQDLLN